ncbi:MAG: hypothetical protein JO307_24705 [Bryobacterales bacterium]|nr:hypothetical protein [Bryobacterales bacterium]
MRKLVFCAISIAAASAMIAATGGNSQAGVIAPPGWHEAADELALMEKVQFTWNGRRYCWYDGGWRGSGWYWCGFNRRRGAGWGGPAGWRGWRRPGRPGFQRPRTLPAPIR